MSSTLLTRSRATLGAGLALALAATLPASTSEAAEPSDPITLIQTASSEPEAASSASCTTSDSALLRRFDLDGEHDAEGGFQLSAVRFGTQEISTVAESMTITVSIFAMDPADPVTSSEFEPLGSTSIDLDGTSAGTIFDVPISATAPADKDLVVELSWLIAEGGFFPSGNRAAELRPAYVKCPGSGSIEEFTPVSNFLPNAIILEAIGKAGECVTAETDVESAESAIATTGKKVKRAKKAKSAKKKKFKKAKKQAEKASAAGPSKQKRAAKKLKKAKKKFNKAKRNLKKAKKARRVAIQQLATARNTVGVECAQPAPLEPPVMMRAPSSPSGGSAALSAG